MKTLREIFDLNRLSTILLYTSIISFIIAFNFSDNPPVSGWKQQFMPFLNNMPLADITFLDSLTGYAVTGNSIGDIDTDYVLKTTNAGFNWLIIFSTINDFRDFRRVMFFKSGFWLCTIRRQGSPDNKCRCELGRYICSY